MSSKQRDVHGSENILTPQQVSLFGYVFLILLQKLVFCCPTICQSCTEKQVNCRSLGLAAIPKNFPKTVTLLYLSGNNLTNILPNELAEHTELAVIYLNNSGIFYIHPEAFTSLRKLYYLYLNGNYIQRLDAGLFDGLFNLHYLHLQQNHIDVLPQGLFQQLKAVRYLYLQNNKLRVLDSNVFFGMIKLHTLNLANNNISRISDTAWHHLDNLEILYLDSNNLIQVPSNALRLLKGLKKLSLSNNQLGSIHNFAFQGLYSLQYLFADSANIQAISDRAFSGLGNLKLLSLSRNGLWALDSKSFTHLNHLVNLQLDHNDIATVADDTFEEMGPSLKVLNLSFNNLTSLQPKVLQSLISLNYFLASYNPWHCGCNLLSLRSFLLSSSYKFSIHCETPSQLQKRPLGNVKVAEFKNCVFTTTNASPKKDSRLYLATTEAMHSHMKSATYKPLFSSQSTDLMLSAGSAFPAFNSNDTQSNTTQSTDEQSPEDILPFPPVNLTKDRENSLPPDIVTVSLKPTVICQQKAQSLKQSFHVLLLFFILSCVAVAVLTFKLIQMKRNLRIPENQGDSVLEYYSCYQSGRYQVTDPLRIAPLNPLQGPGIDLIRPLKQSPPDAQTQVILFEHSAL
ncbi:PREDICTED: leucine-rich repeat-containing protein 70 [Nanorana parkeri]|uniref:leucine-rich repeat-containing protein 70 n=1 Tax=Nanorana parkeri TaxID=125878 RepID=UPI000854DAD6|nr:PREDICTED: leucine-rich repeat-containing protein 70 [Nanorana parkeri]